MSQKDELKAALRSLRNALTDRQGELGLGSRAARWSGAMLRAAGNGPSRKRSAWARLADQPHGGGTTLAALNSAATAVKGAAPATAGDALTKAEAALTKLESLLGS